MRQLSPWRCWLPGWLLLVASGALSQDAFFNIRHFSVEDGMSSRFITNVIQDKQGFIWIGTDYGVNRFDGRSFKVYHSNRSKLRINTRTHLWLDVKGNVWANNERRQVDIIDPLTDVVTPLEELVPQFADKQIRVRGNDQQGVLWGTAGDDILFRYDGRFHIIQAAFGRKDISRLDNIFPSPWGTVFLAKPNKLVEYDSLGNQLNAYPMPKQQYVSASATDSTMIMSRLEKSPNNDSLSVNFWELRECEAPIAMEFSHHGNPYFLKNSKDSYASVGAKRDEQGRVWVVCLNQLLVFDKKGELIAAMPKQQDFWHQVQADGLYFDTQGQAWVRGNQGVIVVSLLQPSMRKLLTDDTKSISVRGIVQLNEEALLACTYDGLFIIDLKDDSHGKLMGDLFFGAADEGDSVIWFGSHSSKLIRFDTDRHKFERVKISDKLNPQDEYLRPFEDDFSGQIYIGTRRQGLMVYDRRLGEVVPFRQVNQFTEFSKLEILYLLPRPDCIWACTSDGLYQLDRQKGIIAKFHDFPSNFIYHLTIDKDGVFWLSTRGGGLVKWFKESNLTKQYTTENGLSHDVIYAAYDDGKGHLWLPSNYGLMRFDKSTGSTVNYLPEEGASGEEFNSDAHLVGQDGTFYFGGLNGITAFHPDSILFNQYTQPLVVTSLKMLNGNKMEEQLAEFRETNEIVVRPNIGFFTLEFALLDFHAKKLVYAWNLEGLDKNWTVQTENSIRFNGLPYGNYLLRLRAQGTGSIWSEKEIAIPISVIRPFHKTWKFLVLCVLAFALITFFSVRWRIRWLRREKQRLTKVVEERTKELLLKNAELESTNHIKDRLFSIIAHDLRAPLVTLGGLARKVAFLMRQGRNDEVVELGETVENSVANVRNLLDNLLKWSIVQGGNFPNNPELLNTIEVVEEVVGLYNSIAEAKGIKLAVSNVNAPTIFADRNALSAIIRNLLDNAIKFTHEGGTIGINIEGKGQETTIKVCDSGTGIPPDVLPTIFELKGDRGHLGTRGEKGNGLGLVLCKELTEINRGTITAYNLPENGAAFSINLPSVGGSTSNG